MKLIELLSVCSDSADMVIQVIIAGESIISSAAMLEGYLCKDALHMCISGIGAESKNVLKVWVGSDE